MKLEAKSISIKLKISDRVKCVARRLAINPTCRLINPSKNEVGKVSKQLLAKIN